MITETLGRSLLLTLLYVVTGTAAAGQDAKTLVLDGVTRSYVVRAPALPAGATRVPMVIVLHGGGGNAANAETMTGGGRGASARSIRLAMVSGGPGDLENHRANVCDC